MDSTGCMRNVIPRSSKRRDQKKCLKQRFVPREHFKKEQNKILIQTFVVFIDLVLLGRWNQEK